VLLRDRLTRRAAEMGDAIDYPRLVAEVLGVRNAPPALARRLVSQALVLEDRRDAWRQRGGHLSASAPPSPGVYVLRDETGRALYVGKTVNLRRRLHAHFAPRRWRALKAAMARVADAEWMEVGSELEALLREAALIDELRPEANVQVGPPALAGRAIPGALVRDVVVLQPSVEDDSVELVCARADGGTMIQRTRRNGVDVPVHVARVRRFFEPGRRREKARPPLAPIVFSWLARRGADATRLDPWDAMSAEDLGRRLAQLLADDELFTGRVVLR
jgi:predicted GIY-YIG superfamily endonuclease